MRLFDLFRRKESALTVVEAQEKIYVTLSEYTGWKFLKSQRCLRKKVRDIVFDINFYSSKYNCSGRSVEINCEFLFWDQQFDKECTVNNKIGFVSFQPEGHDWYDVSTEKKLTAVIDELKMKIDDCVFPLINRFEDDYDSAIAYLSSDDMQEIYHLNKFDTFKRMNAL